MLGNDERTSSRGYFFWWIEALWGMVVCKRTARWMEHSSISRCIFLMHIKVKAWWRWHWSGELRYADANCIVVLCILSLIYHQPSASFHFSIAFHFTRFVSHRFNAHFYHYLATFRWYVLILPYTNYCRHILHTFTLLGLHG